MWRTARTALLCLLLGVAINLAVVWAIIFFRAPLGAAKHLQRADPGSWLTRVPAAWSDPIVEDRTWRIGARFSLLRGSGCMVEREAVGWPALAFQRFRILQVRPGHEAMYEDVVRSPWINGILADHSAVAWLFPGRSGRIPIQPAPVGFAINTVVYATPFFLCSFLLIPLRRRRRIRRGMCPRCAYDRSSIPTGLSCPECGRHA